MRAPIGPFAVLLTVALSCATIALPALAGGHPAIDLGQGWISLFNGKDLAGWEIRDPDGREAPRDGWVVQHGAIARKAKGYLTSRRQYGDFILDLEFKVAPGTNSGIILRHDSDYSVGQSRYWWNGLLEVQILDSHGKEEVGMHDCGSLYDMVAPSQNAMKPPGEWNRMTITAQGSKIGVVMNGQEIIDVDLDEWTEAGKNPDGTPNKYHKPMKDSPRKGHILLQEHGHPVWFRNIYIKPLD